MARKEQNYILSSDSPFAVQEGYRALRTNIIFSLPDSGGKVIGVTSGSRSDRKSSTVINAAISFAELGKRVLLVDCDLRLPTVAQKLNMRAVPGLTDVIVGNSTPNDAIRTYGQNLDVLPAGTIPKDATGIISSERMKKFFLKLREVYDYIFVDFPPVTTVTDAAILSGSVDVYLIAVFHEKTEYKELRSVQKTLNMADANILGFVYTAAPISVKKYYSSYYK